MPVIPAPMVTSGFDSALFREGLREVFYDSVNGVDDKIGTLFSRATSKSNYEEMLSMSGLTYFKSWDERSPITYEGIASRYKTRFTHADFSKGVSYSRKAKRDLKYNTLSDIARDFGNVAGATQQVLAASLFNLAFTSVWNSTEGQFLIDSDHPLDARVGGTSSNLVTGALGISTLQEAITKLTLTPNDVGMPIGIKPKYLLVHPSKMWLADSLVNSPGEYDSPNLAKNTLKGQITPVAWEYLTSETAWYVIGDKTRVYWFDRESLQDEMEIDFDTGDIKHKAWFSSSFGAADWRGIVGSTGA